MENILHPNVIYEVSWEVCNKVGGINTVLVTKAKQIRKELGDKYFLIGPDIHNGKTVSDFEELPEFNNFREYARINNINVRIGRWTTADNTITILVDYNHLLKSKNRILKELWDDYGIDSLNGSWDYIEPVIFGYAVGKFINKFNSSTTEKDDIVVAHFHEWLTGSGLLYLKKYSPNITTTFTTHATILGRTLAGNNYHLYRDLDTYNPEKLASELGVKEKYSLEKASAQNCSAFATVSGVTKIECEKLLHTQVDSVTPNSFHINYSWDKKTMAKKKADSRKKLISIAEKYLGKKYTSEPFIIGTSGRYEFHNKGLDILIESLKLIAKDENITNEILVYITVPAGNNGVRNFKEKNGQISNFTHELIDYNNDPIINAIKDSDLVENRSNVQIIYVPAYINKSDILFECSYYDVLMGMQQTIYASYYEPWGYTPMESIAYMIPTITTTYAGYGLWIKEHFQDSKSVIVIDRNQDTDNIISDISNSIIKQVICYESDCEEQYECAKNLSNNLEWNKLITHYWDLYNIAISKNRISNINPEIAIDKDFSNDFEAIRPADYPTWRRLMIEREVPERLKKLEVLANNLWWSWSVDGDDLFKYINPEKWRQSFKNPTALLHNIESKRFYELEHDEKFCKMLDATYEEFKKYMSVEYIEGSPKIAYFSMEYGIANFLKTYSGGLGILAGDFLKEASDKNINMVAVGLMYKYGYFTQKISASGEQEEFYEAENFQRLPISPVRDEVGNWLSVILPLPNRNVEAKIWLCEVGKTKLYLLDTDHSSNIDEDRTITHNLYGGSWENRLKQEIVLGIGGIKALKLLGIDADIYHCNEGHAAFIGLERIKNIMFKTDLSYSEALEVVRSSSLFTTHTPVPAGHDAFPIDMIKTYLEEMPDTLGITWNEFLSLGMKNSNNPNEKFSMSFLACSLSQEINGVSKLHGEISKKILKDKWPGYFPCELSIGYVTNGVHFPTWSARETKEIYRKIYGEDFKDGNFKEVKWDNIYKLEDDYIWKKRLSLKDSLIRLIKKRLSDPQQFRFDSPRQLIQVQESLKTDVLTIGYARRFATYKRPHLLFDNLERLSKILNNPERPVQIIFAGKAHPKDVQGQELIKKIVKIASMPEFIGKIIFIQNYDMALSKRLVSGVDVWLNTPERPLEASGTSGEKASLNGVLHFSVLDGWWVEGYKEGAGWALPQKQTFENTNHQNEVDSEMIYNTIEEKIVPLYYNRGNNNIPNDWIKSMKKCICEIASKFNTGRMMQDYEDKFYDVLFNRHNMISENNFEKARELAKWKKHISNNWDSIKVLKVKQYDMFKAVIKEGDTFKTEVTIDMGNLSPEDIGVEIVVAKQIVNNKVEIIKRIEFEYVSSEKNIATYIKEFKLENSGLFDVSGRIYAKNDLLSHRMDFSLVKWI